MTPPKLLSLTMTLLVTMLVTLQLATAASMPPPPRLTTKPADVLDLRCSIPWHLALRERWFSLDGFEIKFHHSGTDKNFTLARISATMVSPVCGEALSLMADARGLVQATDILDPRPPYLTILTPLSNDSMGVYYCEVEYSPSSTSGMKTLTYKVDVNTKFMHETFVATDVCFSGKLIVADEVHVTWSKVASRRSHGADTGVRVERITKVGDAAAKPRILVSIRQQDIVDTHRSYGTLLVKLDSPALGVSDSEYTLKLFVEHEQCYPDCVYSCEVGEQRCHEEEEITELPAFENCSVSWILFIVFTLFLIAVILLLACGCILRCPQCRQKVKAWKKYCSGSSTEDTVCYAQVPGGQGDSPACDNASNRSHPQATPPSNGAEYQESDEVHGPVPVTSDIDDNHVGSGAGVANKNTTDPKPDCSNFSDAQNLHRNTDLRDDQPLLESADGRTLVDFTDRNVEMRVNLPTKQASPPAPRSSQTHQKINKDAFVDKEHDINGTSGETKSQNMTTDNTTQSRKYVLQGARPKHVQEKLGSTGEYRTDRSVINITRPRYQSQSTQRSHPSNKNYVIQRSMSDGNTDCLQPGDMQGDSMTDRHSTQVGSETDTSEDLDGKTGVATVTARPSFPPTDSRRASPVGGLSEDSEGLQYKLKPKYRGMGTDQ